MSKPKVFGLGLSRTGTTSLHAALTILGWRTAHWPCRKIDEQEIRQGKLRMSLIEREGFDAITDCSLPITCYDRYKTLYPESKFILTVRDVDDWLASITKHWEGADRRFKWDDPGSLAPGGRLAMFYRFAVFGQMSTNQHVFRNRFNLHWKNILLAFRNHVERLLVFNVKNGWGPLCTFLDVPIPDEPFPWKNKGPYHHQ